MTREEVKKCLPVLEAFAEGETIQKKDVQCGATDWTDMKAEECWEEMKKHEPFGWLTVLGKNLGEKEFIVRVTETTIKIYATSYYGYKEALSRFKFADGTPFGIQVDGADD